MKIFNFIKSALSQAKEKGEVMKITADSSSTESTEQIAQVAAEIVPEEVNTENTDATADATASVNQTSVEQETPDSTEVVNAAAVISTAEVAEEIPQSGNSEEPKGSNTKLSLAYTFGDTTHEQQAIISEAFRSAGVLAEDSTLGPEQVVTAGALAVAVAGIIETCISEISNAKTSFSEVMTEQLNQLRADFKLQLSQVTAERDAALAENATLKEWKANSEMSGTEAAGDLSVETEGKKKKMSSATKAAAEAYNRRVK